MKASGGWHCVLQINLPLPEAFTDVYRVFLFCLHFYFLKGENESFHIPVCICIRAFGRRNDAQKHLVNV